MRKIKFLYYLFFFIVLIASIVFFDTFKIRMSIVHFSFTLPTYGFILLRIFIIVSKLILSKTIILEILSFFKIKNLASHRVSTKLNIFSCICLLALLHIDIPINEIAGQLSNYFWVTYKTFDALLYIFVIVFFFYLWNRIEMKDN